MRIWQIDALQQSRSLHELTEQATLVFDLLPLIAEGVDPTKLALYTRQSEEDGWILVPSDYYPEEALIVARVSHFSQWGLGDYLSASGELLPSVRGFGSDGYTGYANVSYAIETPSGLGGMSPGLSLSYSSGNADDLEIHNGDYAYEVQADWTGFGWNLGGINYIARDFGSGSYRLVMNGLSADIKWNGNKWVTDPDQFLLINHANGPMGYYREDVADWSIQTQDGTTYYFGGNQFNGDGEPVGNWTNILFRDLYVNNGWKSIRVGSKWYLRAVEDRLGNYMEYDYDVEGEGIGGECLIGVWWPDASRWYHKATYLREVRWSGNRNGLPVRMRVQFARENRPDWQVQYWDHRCVQARYAQQRLKTVLVQVYDSVADPNQWYTLRQYQLNYSQSQLHSLLSSIQQYGKHGSQLLHTYSFGYQGGHNNVRLLTANNGQGGSAEYQYGLAWIHDCLSCGSTPWRTGIPLRRPVDSLRLKDGNEAETYIVNTYAEVKGQITTSGFEYLGFGAHSQTTHTKVSSLGLNDTPEQRVQTWYHQRTGNNIDPRRGRSYQQNMRAGVGDALIGYTLTTWQSTVQNGTNWVRKASEERHTHAADGNTQNKSIDRTYYFYESVYGNTVRVEERNATNSSQILRITTTDYVNPGGHMRKPSVVRVFRPDNLCVSEKRMSYNSYGLMINSQQPTSYCGDMNSANVISTNFTYDGYGNLVHEQVDGTNHHIVTHYEGFYALFPIRRYNASTPLLDERMQYYGVKGIPAIQGIAGDAVPDGLSSNDSKGFWGQVQQFCATDDFCTRQSYDSFGRPVHRWDRLTSGQAWPGDAAAATRWSYTRYQSADPNQKANIVVEWHAPRCQGNFTRKLYNGFGQLIQTQSPQQNWSTVVDGCGSTTNSSEVVVHYAYDGLGRQVRTSVPQAVSWAWQHVPNWSLGYTETTYDALGRTTRINEPNQNTTLISYVGRTTSTVQDGNGNDVIGGGDRMVRWQQVDDLGRLQLVRNYTSTVSGGWEFEGEVLNSYTAATDLLTKVEFRGKTTVAYTTIMTATYDLAGRKKSMKDADLGFWSYAYDKLGNLTRQTDARNFSTCLSYDTLNRLSTKTVRSGDNCSAGTVSAGYTYSYDSQGRLSSVQRTSGDSWSKSYAYNTLGLLGYETVTIDGQIRGISHYYDAWQRPYAVSYTDNDANPANDEVVKVDFNALGLPNLLCKIGDVVTNNCLTTYANNASYDATGRLTAVKYPAGGNLWRTQTYYEWTGQGANGGLLNELKVGTGETGSASNDRFYRQYTYNPFGDVATLKEGTTPYSFDYDGLGRLTSAYGQSFSYWRPGTFNVFNDLTYGYASVPYHAVNTVNSVDRYDYDANGNMTVRNKGTGATQQTLEWNAENRLQTVKNNSGAVIESYVYDVDGNRIKKTSGSVVTRTFFPGHYEEEVSGSTTTIIKHYSFNGQIIATRRKVGTNDVLRYTHADHLGSTSGQTDTAGNAVTGTYVRHYAYGTVRAGDTSTLNTDRTFTGQKADSTGLLYFNARYYDPTLGQFLSPDTLVPDAGVVFDYNRYLYTRGNPLKYTDPTGHETSKPDWWPPFLPYVFDLPDDMTYEEFVVWASENNIPTAFSGQAGGSMTAGFLGGGAFSVEVQGTINWLSGEYMLSFNNGGGFRAGTPANGGGFHVGGTLHYRASTTTVLEGASLFSSIDGAAEAGPEAGLVATYARAMDYTDLNDNHQFDLGDGVQLKSVIDPDFHGPVESLSVDATVGVDLTPNVVDVGLTGGMKDTTNIFTLDLYAPVRWIFD